VNTREIDALDEWDERMLTQLVARFVRDFRRLPHQGELVRFGRARGRLELRLPRRSRRRVAVLTH
jgi:hypothetical protein